MSTPLTAVDLTGAVAGTQKAIDFSQFVKVNPAAPLTDTAALTLFNESGCGLQWVMQASGRGGYLPAGGWLPLEIHRNDSNVLLTVIYTLPGAPVSQLLPTYYAPGEFVPPMPILGNSPIGIGGTVNTSSIQTLSNEGGAANMLVEDIGDLANPQLYTLYSDGHALWKVDQAGVVHQVIKIQTAGNPLQLGQTGDVAEVLGNLIVDGWIGAYANIIYSGAGINTNILRDYVNANTFLDASAGDGSIKLSQIGKVAEVLGSLTVDQAATFSAAIFDNPPDVTVAGSVSGTATLWMPLQGKLKLAILSMANYQNGTVTQTLAFPTAFARGLLIIAGGIGDSTHGGVYFTLAGVTKANQILTALAATGGTITANQNNVNAYSVAENLNAVDSINLINVAGAAHTAHVFMIGN